MLKSFERRGRSTTQLMGLMPEARNHQLDLIKFIPPNNDWLRWVLVLRQKNRRSDQPEQPTVTSSQLFTHSTFKHHMFKPSVNCHFITPTCKRGKHPRLNYSYPTWLSRLVKQHSRSKMCEYLPEGLPCELIYTHKYTYIYTCIHIHVCKYIYMCIHTYIHTHIHTYIHTHIHTYIYTYIHTYTHTHIHTYIHPSIHPYIHTYIKT